MSDFPNCPAYNSKYTYQNQHLFICPKCAHEWSVDAAAEPATTGDERIIKDSNGNMLQNNDSITIIKDLKVKDTSSIIKVDTKVKNIHLINDDHNINYKIDEIDAIKLKSKFIKKS